MASDEKEPLIGSRPMLQKYYASLESRLGYRLFLGDTRHFGYYKSSTSFPLPIDSALRAMEGELYRALQCPKGSRVLDAGCGVGHVALFMAAKGDYQVDCIDIVPRHVAKAKRNVELAGKKSSISVRHGDYHHLEQFQDGTFDGVYTMETFVHSNNPRKALAEILRVLKPGGRLAMNEYDHEQLEKVDKDLAKSMKMVNKYSSMPANASFDKGVLEELLKEEGFEDVRLKDMSKNIVPMLWLFYVFALVPYIIFRFLGIEHHFVNTVAGVESYRGRHIWRYIQVTGRKPA